MKTQNEVIQEIHNTFYSEVDRLLDLAHCKNPLEPSNKDLIEKSNRMKSLGFVKTKEVREAEQELELIEMLKKENEQRDELLQAIPYFQKKYPLYRFITEDSVKMICKKYGLVYGGVDRYMGEVPDENLKQIEQFKIDECDIPYEEFNMFRTMGGISGTYTSKEKYDEKEKRNTEAAMSGHFMLSAFDSHIAKCPLEIVAPASDFDTRGSEVVDHQIVSYPDPIVLQPVLFGTNKYYLIVTAWGLEAGDSDVVNANHN